MVDQSDIDDYRQQVAEDKIMAQVEKLAILRKKVDVALEVIAKFITDYEFDRGTFVVTNQPDKVTVTEKSIENLKEIKNILTGANDYLNYLSNSDS
uniref:Uncharacterized protein n=1 Tax=uncultured marine crenarchaeote HF4000_ANIW133K13 TaxID=455572 RepID=B3T428_9ARCH|nr:hypothetical protein ALOHA_HF4000ANIW133K13ctg1g12 [uncultured marine crenarchaeote HF4000_ANIW133K13]